MSAFIVSKRHIEKLVATITFGPANYRTPGYGGWSLPRYLPESIAENIGQALINENLKSIHSRYPDTIEKPENTPGPCERYFEDDFEYTPQDRDRLPVIQALKALACYEYQSCEHDDWKDSPIQQACERFRHALIGTLPGYSDADWEIR